MIVEKEKTNMKKENGIALLPIGVFLVLYLGLGILFEYVLKIPMVRRVSAHKSWAMSQLLIFQSPN